MTQKKTNKWDEKQKAAITEAIFKDNPDLKKDPLQIYYIEKMVESYLTDPDMFNKKTDDYRKLEKKGKLPSHKKLPDEIVCITKGTGEDPKPAQLKEDTPKVGELTIGQDGMVKFK
jgi:hypothetical protein